MRGAAVHKGIRADPKSTPHPNPLPRGVRGLTELFFRVASIWGIEVNSGCESHGDQLPFPRRVMGLTELFFRVASTWNIEPNSGCESHGDQLPLPRRVRELTELLF
jgi:hypothetical protein